MKHKVKTLYLLILPVLLLPMFLLSASAHAATYNYTSYLMDDSTFLNNLTMNATQILHFLEQEGSGLTSFSDVLVCGYTDNAHFNFNNQYYDCSVPVTSNGNPVTDTGGYQEYETQPQSAALIIDEASQAYGINPQVLLATMQKEQSLVTTPNPIASQLNFAMGYGCPDSGGCSDPGFFDQVVDAAWQFRADFDLSSGVDYWGYTPSGYVCNGATKYYSTALVAGNDVTFYDDYDNAYSNFVLPNASTASLYCYTPHVFPGSSEEYYSGSYWFDYYFSLWFGTPSAPYAFKASNSATVYLFVDGYKVVVPYMGELQDYGVNPNAIQTLDPSTVNNIPTPSYSADGISPVLSYIVQPDGSSAIFFVSAGQKYQVQTMQQFTNFGFSTSNLSYLPDDFINNIPGSTMLSNFISTPNSVAFEITGGQKDIIFTYQKYIQANPSNISTPVSYFGADLIPSGLPLTTTPVIIQYSDSAGLYLLLNNNYYELSTYDTYTCWGFNDGSLKTPVYQLSDNSYIATFTPTSILSSCLVNDNSGNTYLLSNNSKFLVPAGFGLSGTTVSTDLQNLMATIPSSGTLQQYIVSNQSPQVWYLSGGNRLSIPTYSDFTLLGITSSELTTIDNSTLSSISANGIKLGNGQLVKSNTSSAVYIIWGSSRILYATSDNFQAYGNNWNNIETYPETTLDQEYPYNNQNISNFLYDQPSNSVYLLDPNGCYQMNSNQLNSYGQTLSAVSTAQAFPSSILININLKLCTQASVYAKAPNQAAVYWINNGTKYVFSGWNALVQQSGTTNPYIITLSSNYLSSLPTGSPI